MQVTNAAAIESTEDYYDTSFHQTFTDINVQNEDGSYGKVVNHYRVVHNSENGLVPYGNNIFNSIEEAQAHIIANGLSEISYDDIVGRQYEIMRLNAEVNTLVGAGFNYNDIKREYEARLNASSPDNELTPLTTEDLKTLVDSYEGYFNASRKNYLDNDGSIRSPAKLLPDGWHWRRWDDGSGGLYSPDGEWYAEYDMATFEYRYKGAEWSFLDSNPHSAGINVSNYIDYIESYVLSILNQRSIGRADLLARLNSLQNGDTFNFKENGNYIADNVHTDFLHIENDGTRRFLHTAPSGEQYYYSLNELLREVYQEQEQQSFTVLDAAPSTIRHSFIPTREQYNLLEGLYSGIVTLQKYPNDEHLWNDMRAKFGQYANELDALKVPFSVQNAVAEAGYQRENWGKNNRNVIMEVCGRPVYYTQTVFSMDEENRNQQIKNLDYEISNQSHVPNNHTPGKVKGETIATKEQINSTLYRLHANPRYDGTNNSHFVQGYIRNDKVLGLLIGNIVYEGTPDECIDITNRLNNGEITEEQALDLWDRKLLNAKVDEEPKADEDPITEEKVERNNEMPKKDDAPIIPGVEQNGTEIKAKDQLSEQLMNGVRSVIDSDKYKDWLKTCGKLFYNNYSFNNSMLVWLQKADATHVMGYEAWKEYGRNVKQGAKGIKILIPNMASEKTKGSLFGTIKRKLSEQLINNPSASHVSYRLGQSRLEFTMNRANHLIGVKIDGKERGTFSSDEEFKRYIDRGVLGKVPMYYSVGTVFDVKDVIVPDYLWLKHGFSKEEIVRDDKDKPINNKRGETKIYNTPERQARFLPALDMEIVAQDPVKMERLFSACCAVSRNNGVAVLLHDKDSDVNLKNAKGYYSREPYEGYPNGLIVLDKNLEPTEKCIVMFHEMGHGDLHKSLDKLAVTMGEDKITQTMREQQAQSVSYGVASSFGIPATEFSFNYIANYTQGFELQELQKSLEVIFKEVQNITKELKAELDKAGYNLDLTEKPKPPLDVDTVKTVSQKYIGYALDQESSISSATSELPSLAAQYKNIPEIMDILKEQKTNLDIRTESVELIKSSVDRLNSARTQSVQDECLETLDQAQKRISSYSNSFESLSERLIFVNEQLKDGLKADFDKDPKAIIKSMKADYTRLSELSEAQTRYVETSKYISKNYGKLLRSDIPGFVENVCNRAALINDYASKNGTFVEVNHCENWFDKPIFEGGEICHPKVADSIFKQAETQVQNIKADAEKRGEYFPYVKCDVTVYSPTANNALSALNTRIDIGDKEQKGLKDHLEASCGRSKVKHEIYSNFDISTRERGVKDKICIPSTYSIAEMTPKQIADDQYVDRSKSDSDWQNDIASEKSLVTKQSVPEAKEKMGDRGKSKSISNRDE